MRNLKTIKTTGILGLALAGLTAVPVAAQQVVRQTVVIVATTTSVVTPTQRAAPSIEAKIYPYASHENYCPAGLQPITISGVICCGVPNQPHTYQQVMKHPAPQRVTHHKPRSYSARPACREGEKGC